MDHPCEKCGASVPEGRPFCPNCRAPQIRIAQRLPEPESPVPAASVPDTQLLPSPEHSGPPAAETAAVWAVIKAGIAGVFLGMIPLLGSVLTGMLAVWLYRRAGGHPTARPAARMGALAAALALSISAFLTVIQVFVFHARQQSEEALVRLFTALGVNMSDPELQANIHSLFTPSGLMRSFIIALLITLALGGLGGFIVSVSRPRSRL